MRPSFEGPATPLASTFPRCPTYRFIIYSRSMPSPRFFGIFFAPWDSRSPHWGWRRALAGTFAAQDFVPQERTESFWGFLLPSGPASGRRALELGPGAVIIETRREPRGPFSRLAGPHSR